MKEGYGVSRIFAMLMTGLSWLGRTFDGRDLHIYGGLGLLGYGLVVAFGSVGVAVLGALVFGIGVFGVPSTRGGG